MHAQDDAAAEVEFDPRPGLLPPVGGRPEREFHELHGGPGLPAGDPAAAPPGDEGLVGNPALAAERGLKRPPVNGWRVDRLLRNGGRSGAYSQTAPAYSSVLPKRPPHGPIRQRQARRRS